MLRVSTILIGLLNVADASPVVRITGQAGDCSTITAYNYEDTTTWKDTAGWELCGSGTVQSPIDIVTGTADSSAGSNLGVVLTSVTDAERINNGHAIEVEGNFASLSTFAGAQLHFHAPSENTVDGVSYPLEMHIVMTETTDGTTAITVVSVLFEEPTDDTPDNECLNGVFAETPNAVPEPGFCDNIAGDTSLSTCLDSVMAGDWWSFEGSLTTPPCTEGVQWKVMKEKASISKTQLQAFTDKYPDDDATSWGNNRPTQTVATSRIIIENTVTAPTPAPTTAPTEAPATEAPTPATTPAPAVDDNTLVIVLVVVVVILLIGGGGYASQSGEEEVPEEGAEMTEPPPEEEAPEEEAPAEEAPAEEE